MKLKFGIMRRYISPYTYLLIMLVHLQISVALFLNECPEKLIWTLRAKQLCGVEAKYMCLYDVNARKFRELCKDGPEFHRPGNIFIISGNLQYFAGRQCNANRYQPHKWWTNGSSDCQYLKSSCNEEGQVPYDNGTITKDRKCRCDYTNYYSFVNGTKHKCYCDPTEEDCSCYIQRCHADQVLTPDYNCVGEHEWTGQYVCPEYKQPKVSNGEKMRQETICPNIRKDVFGILQQSTARIVVSVTFGIFVILCIMTRLAYMINRNALQTDFGKLAGVYFAEKKVNLDIEQRSVKTELEQKEVIPWIIRERKVNLDIEQRLVKTELEQTEVIPLNIRDQIQRQIEDWKQKDEVFVPTRASNYVMECLQNYSCLTLTAPSGVGKSFIARHTALVLKKEGYNIIPVYSPTDIKTYYQPGQQTVFIVDDICGNFTANQQQIDIWEQLLPVINTIIADKCCKIIVSCRLQVYKDDKFNILSPFKSCECNLISDNLGLTSLEKNNIAKTYLGTRMKYIDDIPLESDFIPLLCSLNHGIKDVNVREYFINPFKIYKSELDGLSKHGDEGNYKLCSLALCALFNNQLNEKWFQGKATDEQRHIIEDTCDACDINRSASKARLRKSLDTLVGTFICKQNGIYRAVHDKLFDFLAHFFGQNMLECLIDRGDSDLVHERFIWQKSDDRTSNIEFIIEIPDDYLELYLQRLIKDWLTGKVTVVFSNSNMKVSSFRQNLLENLKQLDKSLQVTLTNTKDTVIPYWSCASKTTPLVCTCYYGYTDMVEWMVHNDVDVDQCRNDGISGLLMASANGHTDIVKVLLERNADVNLCHKDGSSPLLLASCNGHNEIVKLLLKRNPDVDLCDKNYSSPLLLASYKGHTDIVKLLLERNPDVDLCDKDCFSPLLQASQNGHTNIVKLLLERNAYVNLCDREGLSPLLQASKNGHTEIVKLLLERNVNVNLCNEDGVSPLYMASQNEHTEIVKLLLERNAIVDLCNEDGVSPLLQASYKGHTEIVKLLFERNADVNICDKDGLSPLYMASQNGHTDIVKLLLKEESGR